MDREIPKEVRNKERNKKIIRYGAIGVAGIVVVSVLISLMRTGVKEKDLVFSKVGKGTIEVSVSASGKVVPAFEEIINSPINTRILEVYRKGGDSVDVGTPILKLDLQSAETDYKKMLDEEQMRSYKLKQLKLDNQTKLTDLQMKIKVSAMKLDRMKVELRNEQYLDSLGSGTTDKVRQAELSYNVAQLEYEQLQQQYANEKEVLAAGTGFQHVPKDTGRNQTYARRCAGAFAPEGHPYLYQQSDWCPGSRRLTDCRHLRLESLQGGRRDCRYLR